MAITVVTAPSIEPLTVQQVKDQLRLEIDADDSIVRRYIKVARQWVEGQTRRALTEATYDYSIDYDWPCKYGMQRITLPLNPVSSVTSVTYVDDNGASQTLAGSQYIVSAREHGSYIAPAYDVEWPTVRHIPSAITIRFVAGVSDAEDVPEPLRHAVALIAAELYESRTESVGRVMQRNPMGIEALISPYRSATCP